MLFGAPGRAPVGDDGDVRHEARDIDVKAIRRQIRAWNSEMESARQAGWETNLIFYYSGHGDVKQAGEGGSTLRRSYLPLGDEIVDADRAF